MGQTVLVVDDEVEIADLVELYLKNEGFEVRKFYNGRDALDCVRTQALDLAILDVMLPDMDGFTLCARIRGGAFLAHHHAHGQSRGHRQDNGPHDRCGRLHHEAPLTRSS